MLPARSPNLNAYSERWVKSVKEECLSRLILFGEGSLRRALQHYLLHYRPERNHEGLGNRLIRGIPNVTVNEGAIHRRPRLGGMLNYYYRAVA